MIPTPSPVFELNERGSFSAQGCEILVFSNWYDGLFSDAKIAGVEMIHHGVRTVTNGDVRLSPTPAQWDPVPVLKKRSVLREQGVVETMLGYDDEGFDYTIIVRLHGDGVRIEVHLESPLPATLEGKAGFNLEFLPSAYYGKHYMMDGVPGLLPRHPRGPTGRSGIDGATVRLPVVTGKQLILAPEDSERRISVCAEEGVLQLFDGRNQAQSGWYVLRSLIPSGKRGTVISWTLSGSRIPDWIRPAVIGHSQVGYHPMQRKVAVIERDGCDRDPLLLRLLRIGGHGKEEEVHTAEAMPWGHYLRYRYATFDFSHVVEPGLFVIESAGTRTQAFRIANDIYDTAWIPTLDLFFPVQMDHMTVREGYRVWHGRSHMDDARQAPPDFPHFDLYGMGPDTDSPFEPWAHIPGLAVGGWFDAGDYDLRTQTHYCTVRALCHLWLMFRPERDETTVDQARGLVEIHQPDGTPDLLQQIEHGTLMLIVQHRVFGHAIPGIVEPDLRQYTHLGDAVTKTDGRIHDPADPDSPADDRLAFTTNTTALNYGSSAALAAASRALRGYRDVLAEECLDTAIRVWEFEKARTPNRFHVGNTTGGHVGDEEITCATELLLTTGDPRYAEALRELWPVMEERFSWNAVDVLRVYPFMDETFQRQVRLRAIVYREEMRLMLGEHPYGVPITREGWAGNAAVVAYGMAAYYLHRTFPDLFESDPTHRALEYLFGCHPDSNLSFVSGVGARSKEVAYGMNRADFSFIPGGVVPGVLILNPDFPENKEDWPFFWGQNEYVIDLAANYMLLVHLAKDLVES